MAHLSDRYRVIAYDHRGQGQSEVTPGGYDMDTLTRDALSLLDELGVEKCHFAGLSMGGFVGLRLAAWHPERLHSLILLGTSAQPEPRENIPRYRLLTRIMHEFFVVSGANGCQAWLSAGMSRVGVSQIRRAAKDEDSQEWRAVAPRNRSIRA